MKNFFRMWFLFISLSLFSASPIFLNAQCTTDAKPGGDSNTAIHLTNPVCATSLTDFLTAVLTGFLEVLTVVAVFYIIYSGFMLVTSRGDPKKREEAISSFTWAVIGTAVLLGATALANIIKATVDAVKAT